MPIALVSAEIESDPSVQNGRLAEFLWTAQQRRPQLVRMAQRMTQNADDAEDVVQEAFMKAFKALAKFRGESQMSSWLGAIVQNTAREHRRSRNGRVFLSIECMCGNENEVYALDLRDRGKNPEENCEGREMEGILRVEVNKLTMVCRRAIELCVLEEHSQFSAANALNLSVKTVKSRVFRGKRLLNQMIARRMTGCRDLHPRAVKPSFDYEG
ncbi:MAG: RNA polymerase sigma factor [Terracidiphilus sp.]